MFILAYLEIMPTSEHNNFSGQKDGRQYGFLLLLFNKMLRQDYGLSMRFLFIIHLVLIFLFPFPSTGKPNNNVEMLIVDGKRCFKANGIPDHPTGKFPNRGNPNSIQGQRINACITANPLKGKTPTPIRGTLGIAVNGVLFRPNTAGFWDPNAKQGHSRFGNKKWSLDIFGAPGRLGLDFNNGHVGRGGLYHYHGIAERLLETSGTSLVGYAGDGFEIHYLPEKKKSGWFLRQGTRPVGAPPGFYSGLFNEDYEYVGGKNKLDRCNGGSLDGKYAYFITDQYPFLPRCLYGKISSDFNRSRHH